MPRQSFTLKHLERMGPGLVFFNAGKFWECHEEWEHLWREETDNAMRYIYWALIQTATALYHIGGGHLEGARGQIAKAREKFLLCVDGENSLLEDRLNWSSLKSLVLGLPEVPDFGDFKALTTFKFPLESLGNQ